MNNAGYVTRRKISGGTRSEAGRRARDTFVGLKKTCRKLGISFWHFLISRLRGDGQIQLEGHWKGGDLKIEIIQGKEETLKRKEDFQNKEKVEVTGKEGKKT